MPKKCSFGYLFSFPHCSIILLTRMIILVLGSIILVTRILILAQGSTILVTRMIILAATITPGSYRMPKNAEILTGLNDQDETRMIRVKEKKNLRNARDKDDCLWATRMMSKWVPARK